VENEDGGRPTSGGDLSAARITRHSLICILRMDEVLMRSAAGDGVMRDRRKTSIPIATRAVRGLCPCDRDRLVGTTRSIDEDRSLF
jgi:hypothetical protein